MTGETMIDMTTSTSIGPTRALQLAEAEVSRCCAAVVLASTHETRAALTDAIQRRRALKDDLRLARDYAQRLLDEERGELMNLTERDDRFAQA
jgi:hypothetical protein